MSWKQRTYGKVLTIDVNDVKDDWISECIREGCTKKTMLKQIKEYLSFPMDKDGKPMGKSNEVVKTFQKKYEKILEKKYAKIMDTKDGEATVRAAVADIDHESINSIRMGPNMKAEFLFHQNFPYPANVNKITKDRWARIALNSTGKQISYKQKSTSIVKYAVLGVIVLGVVWMVIKIITTLADRSVMTVNMKDVLPKQVEERQKKRGLLASLITALTFSLTVNTFIDATGKVSSATSTALIGMILGGTIGFLLDNALGSEDGFAKTSQSLSRGTRHAFDSMASGKYGRYIVTILFDMFFTVILFKPIFLKMIGLPFLGDEIGGSIANGLTSTIISIVTFYCYANLTRFQWAYPSKSAGKESWIKGNMIVLIVAVMAVVYLITNTQLFPGEVGVNDPNTKLYIVLGCMGLLGMLMSSGVIDQRDDNHLDSEGKLRPESSRWVHGLALFGIILVISIFGTYATSNITNLVKKWAPPVAFVVSLFAIALIMCFVGNPTAALKTVTKAVIEGPKVDGMVEFDEEDEKNDEPLGFAPL